MEREFVARMVVETLVEVAELNPETQWDYDASLYHAYEISSVHLIELLLALEAKLGFSVDHTELESDDLESVNRLTDFLCRSQASS